MMIKVGDELLDRLANALKLTFVHHAALHVIGGKLQPFQATSS